MFIKFTPDKERAGPTPANNESMAEYLAVVRGLIAQAAPDRTVVHEWNAHRATLFSDPDAYTRDMLNRAVNTLGVGHHSLGALERALEQALPGLAVSITQVSGAPIPKTKPEPTEEDKALHRALSRSKGTFSRENQCGWVADE